MVLMVQIAKNGKGRLNKSMTFAIKNKVDRFLVELVAQCPTRLRTCVLDLTDKIRIA